MTVSFDAAAVDWRKGDGLVPAIVQDARSGRVLMLGYMSEQSLEATLGTSLVTFYSRSKKRLWQKGESSGHVLRLRDIKLDCDADTFLILANPEGPTCHLGTQSCFGSEAGPPLAILADLANTIRARRDAPPNTSYTSQLLSQGVLRVAQKVGEEGVETALAAVGATPRLAEEAADLIYHLLVLLEVCAVDWHNVIEALERRASSKKANLSI